MRSCPQAANAMGITRIASGQTACILHTHGNISGQDAARVDRHVQSYNYSAALATWSPCGVGASHEYLAVYLLA